MVKRIINIDEDYKYLDMSEAIERLKDFRFNYIDALILITCGYQELSVAEIRRIIQINHKNLLPHLKKLQKYELIRIKNKGKGRKKQTKETLKQEEAIDKTKLNLEDKHNENKTNNRTTN